ncbi:NAD-dependent epimerase/dehydratase family protein [Pengzhenrongella sicca]|uniref:NAD-dependent epimerase/dehydratase family protein n=1 Tax=Pengzhenrongella sicca TaxID=2819238 RepID=A0A8A4ZJA3_9MICO|nr:NAD-dependent epimerase/dehydratase family protein [Pengzhenrongella sicca]QTE30576.1 NAD-dependent epimerase/dehydratase family protein [Pengzhenrongella sicca]
MRVLVLGGNGWVGRLVAEGALARGHEVTCLARGTAGAPPTGAVVVRADRDGPDAYRDVVGTAWDAVLDVSRQPGHVRRACAALSGSAATFAFVSSSSVYAGAATPGDAEDADLLPALAGDVLTSMDDYGQAKVACEQHVLDAFGPERSLLARCGLIGGPGDESDRTGYWPARFDRPAAADGSVLVPDVPELGTQVLDVRDLAAWLVGAVERALAGIFNVAGETVRLPDHLAVARSVAGHVGPVVHASPDWLIAHDVEPWAGPRSLPLWLPWPEYAGFAARSTAAARAAGLVTRSLAQTLADTLAWERARPEPENRRAGLTRPAERALLALDPPRSGRI